LRASWAREAEPMVRNQIIAAWTERRLSLITKDDIHALLDSIIDRPAPVLANRVHAMLRKLCAWALDRGLIATSPLKGVKAPSDEQSRDRWLDDLELAAVWKACDGLSWPQAITVLADLPRIEGAGLVFTTNGKTPAREAAIDRTISR
jgi:hypothetical protein